MKKIIITGIAAAVSLMMVGAIAEADNINVVVNGQAVQFNGASPQEVNGTVLVPLRGVFEELGAQVTYNPTSRTIFASKGSTSISLSLGSSTAYVDNNAQQLQTPPAVMMGSTLVPLRFVAESLGAYVEWQPTTNTVQIQSADVASAQNIPAQSFGSTSTIEGRITDVSQVGGREVLTVDTDSGSTQVKLRDDTSVDVRTPGSEPTPSTPDALHVGDRITAEVRSDGDARSIVIRPEIRVNSSVSGRITDIDNFDDPGQITVNTDSGPVHVHIDQDTAVNEQQIRGNGSQSVTPRALRIGDDVHAQLRPDGSARSIDVTFDEHRGRVISIQHLPDDVTALILDNGHTYLFDSHTPILHDHQNLGRDIESGDMVTIRQRANNRIGYTIDVE